MTILAQSPPVDAISASSAWETLKGLHVCINPSVSVDTQVFRNQCWYVLTDNDSGETFRVADSLRFALDSKFSGQSIGSALALVEPHANEQFKEQVSLALIQLYRSHLVEFTPGEAVPVQLSQLRLGRKQTGKPFNPLSIRLSLFNPENVLNRLKPFSDRLFAIPVALSILVVVLAGLFLGLSNATAIGSDLLSQIETPSNWWLFVAAYVSLKLVHEFAHGMAVKRWNGTVHDVGLMLLVFFPVPYLDATSSNAFSHKSQRMCVAAAGIVAEALCASLAVLVWLAVEPGLVRTFAFDVILIGGISTVLFNGNPLMRFDAYYVLADYLEIPNLFTKSRKHLDYCLIRYCLGDANATPVANSSAEAAWFFSYGVLSSFYRLFVMIGITTYLVNTFFIAGVLLAIWVAVAQLILPVWRFLVTLRRADKQAQRRVNLITRFAGFAIVLFSVLIFVPMPQSTVVPGVVTVEDDAQLRAKTDGFVQQSIVHNGGLVENAQSLATLSNESLQRDLAVTNAAIKAIQAELAAAHQNGVEAGIIHETLQAQRSQLAEIETQLAMLNVESPTNGILVSASAKPLTDSYVTRGQTLGYVVEPGHLIVRAVVREEEFDAVQRDIRAISLKTASNLSAAHSASLIRLTPSAIEQLPSQALGTEANGTFAVDPSDEKGLKPLQKLFQVDVKTDVPLLGTNVATRAYVRFVHSPEPLMPRALRAARRLFLSNFST